MQTNAKSLFVLMVLTLQAPLQAVAAEKAQPDPAIEKIANAYLKAILAGDAAAVGATYRDDAVLMPPCWPPLKGRAAIEQYYRGLFEGSRKITEFMFPHLETAASGEIGFAIGAYKQRLLSKSGEPTEDSGNFVVIVKRDAGVWKAACMIYNTDRPPAMSDTAAPVLISPFPALRTYYATLGSEWLVRFGFLSLGCTCFGLTVWLVRTVLRRDASAHGAEGGT
jgi:uncharacterized protein (TIGR02246 family)